jgi:hypothetical protein
VSIAKIRCGLILISHGESSGGCSIVAMNLGLWEKIAKLLYALRITMGGLLFSGNPDTVRLKDFRFCLD